MSLEVFNETTTDLKHQLPSNEVHSVFVDSQNRVWFATDQGAAVKEGTNDVVTYGLLKADGSESGLPNRLVRAIGELNGSIYAGTWGGGAAVLDESDSTWTTLLTDTRGDTGLVDTRVSAIVSDGSTLWFGTVNGTSQYRDTPGLTDDQRWTNHTNKMGFSRVVSQMHFIPGTSRGDEVWIATKDGGITVIRPSSWTRYTAGTTGLPQNDVNGIAHSSTADLIWVGMATQCVASVDVDASTWTHLTTVDGFASNLVTGVGMRDDAGTEELWIGTQTGLSVRRDTRVINFIKGSGLPAERVRGVIVDRNGEIWAWFVGAGAGRVDQYEK
jgi:ligand-binding sensor domain-containing protein